MSGNTRPRMYLITNVPNPGFNDPRTDGTLRWQAPELMAGDSSQFLAPMDVYAFAICCVEILNKGSLPWPLLDDDAIRYLVLSEFFFHQAAQPSPILGYLPPTEENRRPDIQNNYPWRSDLAEVIGLCWKMQPASRPEFPKIVDALDVIGRKYKVSLQHVSPDLEKAPRPQRRSLDMRPSSPTMSPREYQPYLSLCSRL